MGDVELCGTIQVCHRLIYSRSTLPGGPARAIVALISITTSILALCEVDVKANDSRCTTNGPNRSENIKNIVEFEPITFVVAIDRDQKLVECCGGRRKE